MARTFLSASSEYLEANFSAVTAAPFTMACWFNPDQTALFQMLMTLTDQSLASQMFRLQLDTAGGGQQVGAEAVTGGSGGRAEATTTYSTGTWQHACGVFTSPTLRAAFMDGGNKGTNTTSKAPSGIDRMSIGRLGDSTPSGYFDGSIAEAAIWGAALTDDEVASLGLGYSSDQIRPESLAFYSPLIRDEDRDIFGGLTLTVGGTPTVSNHPRMIYPSAPSIVPALAAASIIRWNVRGGIVLQTDANWGGTHFFEATLRATKGTMYARLTTKAGVPVADSEISTSSSTRTRVRSSAITLADATDYVAQTGWVPGTDEGFANRPTIITI